MKNNTTSSSELFKKMKEHFMNALPEDMRQSYAEFGEKFHKSFDVESGRPYNSNDIDLEEALSYVVESLKSGLHPSFLNEDEKALLTAGYGKEWYSKWGYTMEDVEKNKKK